jgi:hypothetical protein
MRQSLMKYIACYLAFVMFLIGIAPKVDAGLSPSEVVAIAQPDRAADLQKIQTVLETKMVGERLKDLGFTENEIRERLRMLSDAQIHNIALDLDQLKVGGNGLGVVIALLIIAILVVLLIQLTGHRVVVQ